VLETIVATLACALMAHMQAARRLKELFTGLYTGFYTACTKVVSLESESLQPYATCLNMFWVGVNPFSSSQAALASTPHGPAKYFITSLIVFKVAYTL
jgi:hypothetical protein